MMKKIIDAGLKLILISTFLISLVLTPFTVEAASKTSKATNIKELKQELDGLKQEKSQNEKAKAQTQGEINTKNNQIKNANSEIKTINEQIEQAEIDIEEGNKEIIRVTNETNDILRFLQISNGENAYLEYITGAESTTDLILRASTVEQITNYNKQSLEDLDALIKRNEQLKIDLAKKNNELEDKIVSLGNSIQSLGNKLSELSDMNEDINSQIKNQQALIDYYKTVCKNEDQKLTDCVDLAAAAGWLRPLVKGYISSLAGYRTNPLTGASGSFHNANDIAGNAEGTKVYAPALGRVSAITRKSSCGGNIVYIHHNINGKAYTTQFAHLLTIGNIKVGDSVNVNTIIGTVGGGAGTKSYDKCSTGAHLHYGVAKGHYLGGGPDGYSKWSTYLASTVTPPGFPGKGVWWYKR